MEKNIFVKNDVLKSLPSIVENPRTPILFAESGFMRSSKDKPKKCVILVNLNGLFLFRPGKGKIMKVSQFVSSLSINEIKYVDKKRRDITTNNRNLYIICDHPDIAIVKLITSRKQIFYQLREPNEISFRDYPFAIEPESYANEALPNLPLLRYICYSYRFGCTEVNERMQEFFLTFDPENTTIASFDDQTRAPTNLKSIIFPIIYLSGLTTVHFKNFAPYCTLRLAHHLIKKSMKIRTIIFENYTEIDPRQLRLANVPSDVPLSFVFLKCNLKDEIWISLIEELSKYQGEFQRLSIISCDFSKAVQEKLFNCLRSERAFRALEIFEYDQMNKYNETNKDDFSKEISSTLARCRSIQKISFSKWNNPINLSLRPFLNHNLLSEIILTNQDMSNSFPEDILLPSNIHLLDFSSCTFTLTSLKSLFFILSRSESLLSLKLADIVLPEQHWNTLLENFTSLSAVPLKCLCDFDWSGNRLTSQSCKSFCDLLFYSNPIRFLSLDRVFNASKQDVMQLFFSMVPKGKLWGLSIGGSHETNFSGSINSLLSTIQQVLPLQILHIDGQRLVESDADVLVQFLKANPGIHEISFDDTLVTNERKFYDIYKSIIDMLHIKAIGRPIHDQLKIFGFMLMSVSKMDSRAEFDELRKLFSEINAKTNASIRANYLCSKAHQGQLDYTDLADYSSKYPASYFDIEALDFHMFNQSKSGNCRKSLLEKSESDQKLTIVDMHAKFMDNPLKNGQNDLMSLFSKYRNTILYDDFHIEVKLKPFVVHNIEDDYSSTPNNSSEEKASYDKYTELHQPSSTPVPSFNTFGNVGVTSLPPPTYAQSEIGFPSMKQPEMTSVPTMRQPEIGSFPSMRQPEIQTIPQPSMPAAPQPTILTAPQPTISAAPQPVMPPIPTMKPVNIVEPPRMLAKPFADGSFRAFTSKRRNTEDIGMFMTMMARQSPLAEMNLRDDDDDNNDMPMMPQLVQKTNLKPPNNDNAIHPLESSSLSQIPPMIQRTEGVMPPPLLNQNFFPQSPGLIPPPNFGKPLSPLSPIGSLGAKRQTMPSIPSLQQPSFNYQASLINPEGFKPVESKIPQGIPGMSQQNNNDPYMNHPDMTAQTPAETSEYERYKKLQQIHPMPLPAFDAANQSEEPEHHHHSPRRHVDSHKRSLSNTDGPHTRFINPNDQQMFGLQNTNNQDSTQLPEFPQIDRKRNQP